MMGRNARAVSGNRILVIKLGALGDFVAATGAFSAIRAQHPKAHITLLTTSKMRAFAESAPWFDAVVYEERKKIWNLPYLWNLKQKLAGYGFVYDLQTNTRTGWYFRLAGKPLWSGIAKGCSHPHKNADRNKLHTLDRLADQLKDAGISKIPLPELGYVIESAGDALKESGVTSQKFVALVPGASTNRPLKRWPHYQSLIQLIQQEGHQVVLLGGPDEADLLKQLAEQTGAVDLQGKISLPQLLDVVAKAGLVVGNDTGPMHMAAAVGANALVLFGEDSDPALCAPRGKKVQVMHHEPLATLTPQKVWQKAKIQL